VQVVYNPSRESGEYLEFRVWFKAIVFRLMYIFTLNIFLQKTGVSHLSSKLILLQRLHNTSRCEVCHCVK